jgi:hypothetical protein
MLDKEVRGQLALLWSFLPKADDTHRCVGGLLVLQDRVRCFG